LSQALSQTENFSSRCSASF